MQELLSPVNVQDFADIGREHNGTEIIAALNIIKAAEAQGLNLNALVHNLNALVQGEGAPFGNYPVSGR